MKLIVRRLGSLAPHRSEVPCKPGQSVGDLLAALAAGSEKGDGQTDRHKLVYRGRVLHNMKEKLCHVVADGDVLVLLPRRSVPPRPPPPEPTKGPTLREINAAIRDDLAAQGPGRLEAAEAAARREGQAGGGAGGLGGALPDVQALEQALMSGEMGALRAYLDQLQEALRGAEGLAAAGAGGNGAALAEAGELPLTAALDLMFGMGGGAAGQAAAQQQDEEVATDEEEEEEDEEGSEEGSEEEEEEEEEYSDEEGSEEEEEHGGLQVPDPDPALLAELREMGFPQQLCRNALLMGRNRFEPALEWLLEHAEEPAAAEPLSDAQLARLYGHRRRQEGRAVDPGALAMLQDMGFDGHQAEQALRTYNNNLNAATSWLLNLGALAAAAPQPAGGGGQAAAGSEQAHAVDQPAAAQAQQAEAGGESRGSQSMRSSMAGSEQGNSSDEEGSQPAGADVLPGLASDGSSDSGSDADEAVAQARQPGPRQQAGDEPPGLNSESDGGSSYDGSDWASEQEDNAAATGAAGQVEPGSGTSGSQ